MKPIIIADQDLIEKYQETIDQILTIMGHDPEQVLVTNESYVSDFFTFCNKCWDEVLYARLCEMVGVEFNQHMPFWEFAKLVEEFNNRSSN